MKTKRKRMLAWILSALLFGTSPGMVLYAEEAPGQTKTAAQAGLCSHHPEHDESCGYQEAQEALPCTCGYDLSSEEGADQSDGPLPEDRPDGHAEDCTYREAVPEAPCTFVCSVCTQPDQPDPEPEPEPLPSDGPEDADSPEPDAAPPAEEPGDEKPDGEAPGPQEIRIISSWTWIDEADALTGDILLLPAESGEELISVETLQSLLPEKIRISAEETAPEPDADSSADTEADGAADTEANSSPDTGSDNSADTKEDNSPDTGADTKAGISPDTAADNSADTEEVNSPDTGADSSPDTEDAKETVPLEGWNCPEYPEEGACTGSYVFRAKLPDGYALSEDAEALELTVEFVPAEETVLLTADSTPADVSAGLIYETAANLPLEETVFQAGGGTIIWKPVTENGSVVRGQLVLRDAGIQGGTIGIQMPVSTEIILEGTNTITAENSSSGRTGVGICLIGNLDLTIRGEGSLTVDSPGTGIMTGGSITVEQAGELTVTYGNADRGLSVTGLNGPITIKDCPHVTVKSRAGTAAAGGGAIFHQNVGNIIIENSHVNAVSHTGPALHTVGEIRCSSSELKAVGHTNDSHASGTLSYQRLTVTGGMMYLENTGTDEVLPLTPNRSYLEQGAVLYCKSVSYVPWLQGDGVWYMSCTYDETADEITRAAVGNVIGDVLWNEHIRFIGTTVLNIGNYADASLTIPEGTTVQIPNGCLIYNKGAADPYTGTLINAGTLEVLNGGILQNGANDNIFTNKGTLHIQDGGEFYNIFNRNTQKGGTLQNSGQITIDAGTMFQNQSVLENSGTIDAAAGSFYTILLPGYNAVIQNTGTINGFVTEAGSPDYTYRTYGDTVLRTGQMLTLRSSSTDQSGMIMQVPADTRLTIESGAIVDARTNLTKDNLSRYLGVSGELVIDGQLWLPEDTAPEEVQALAEHVSGTGKVLIGDSSDAVHYIVSVSGSSASASGRGLYRPGGTVAIDAGLQSGRRFKGWSAPEGVVLADASAIRTSFVMPDRSVQIAAQWEIPVTDIRLDRISLSMLPGDTAPLHMTILPSDASNQNVTWTSDRPDIASVDENGCVKALAPGLAVITVTASDGQQTASCTVRVKEAQELPEPPAETEDTQFKLIFTQGMTEIPPALCEKGLDTQEKIEAAFRLEISQKHAAFAGKDEALYDVTLLVRRQGSSIWEKADASNFPSDGKLQVILPYPEGTGRSTHDFLIVHMFTTSDFGKTPGGLEFPKVTKTDQGIRFEVTGLSPIFLSWKEAKKPGSSGSHSSGGSGSSGSSAGSPVSQPSQTGAATADTQNPRLWILSALLSAAGVCFLWKRRKGRITL